MVLLTKSIPVSQLTIGQIFILHFNGRKYKIKDQTISIHDKKIQYVIAESQGTLTAFKSEKLVYPRT